MDTINNGTQTKVIDGVVYQAVQNVSKVEAEIVSQVPSEKKEIVSSQPTVLVGDKVSFKLSTGETFNIQKPNINDPREVITYGSDIQRRISEVLESTATMTVQQQKTFLSDEALTKIVSFEESLDDAKKSSEEKVGLLKGLLTKLRIGMNDESAKKSEDMKTYQGRYKDYTENLEKVCENLSAIAKDALLDINQRAELAQALTPIVESLDIAIKYGKEELNDYNEETAVIGEQDKSDDGVAIVKRRTQLSTVFYRQINGLEKALVLYKAQIQDYLLQQDVSMTTVQVAHDFIDKQKPVLQVKASGTIYNRLENERLNSLLEVTEAANAAIIEGSQSTVENIKLATELSEQSGFTMEAIEVAMSSLEEGVTLIKERREMMIQRDRQEQSALRGINDRLEEQKREILNLIEDKSIATIAVEEDRGRSGRPRSLTTSRRPRLGNKR